MRHHGDTLVGLGRTARGRAGRGRPGRSSKGPGSAARYSAGGAEWAQPGSARRGDYATITTSHRLASHRTASQLSQCRAPQSLSPSVSFRPGACRGVAVRDRGLRCQDGEARHLIASIRHPSKAPEQVSGLCSAEGAAGPHRTRQLSLGCFYSLPHQPPSPERSRQTLGVLKWQVCAGVCVSESETVRVLHAPVMCLIRSSDEM